MTDTSIIDTIGKTPLVRVSRVLTAEAKANDARILIKLEMQNPGGSIKDRIAKAMLEDAERRGTLKPGMTVVEYTSGNTGIGIAMICAAKGYKCIIVMPQLPPFEERYIVCRMFGADVHLTAPARGMPGLKEYTEDLVSKGDDFFLVNQFYNEANPKVHYETTGPEIWEQSGENVDYFVTGVGTGGTATGVGKYLVEKNPECNVICVEPTESRVHVGAAHSPHSILGIGAGVPTHFLTELAPGKPYEEGSRGHVSEFLSATSSESIEWATKLANIEGIMVGPSSGATFKVAMDVAARPEAKGKTIVVIAASHGIRYTAHPLWKETKEEAKAALPQPPNMSKEEGLLFWDSSKA
eukprot:CAMPEP_0181109700 /NCGR_PEP_ID=MMETSP1071-20121207/18317_1 /TAXON_ID=35127 /ORGANISM="Thalassiosira sp., Strain NH16" /LENGTH=352 /DNA_ID=CAMNT_0023193415 /DNA_START=52 /DNA_END=1110 /DNA_ORIENTATION=+